MTADSLEIAKPYRIFFIQETSISLSFPFTFYATKHNPLFVVEIFRHDQSDGRSTTTSKSEVGIV